MKMREAMDAEARGASFDMHTNIKARPGSQGTLFQGGKPVAQHRWPRGYSPTRMARVEGTFEYGGGVHVTAAPGARNETDVALTHPHFNPHSDAHTRRLMLEPIARSTIPTSHLGGISGGLHLRMTGGTTPGEVAHYDPTTRTINVNPNPWPTTPDDRVKIARSDATIIHEVGHHADISSNPHGIAEALRQIGMEGIRPALEENADRYMLHHFRNDPRNQRKTGHDVRKETYGGRGATGSFQVQGIYQDPGAEPPPVNKQQFGDEQMMLFNPHAPSRTWKNRNV